MTKEVTTIRVDSDVKKKAKAIFSHMGMDFTTGVNVYLTQVAMQEEIPFKITTKPRYSLDEAIKEGDDILAHPEKYQSYSSVDELMRALDEQED